MAKPKKSKLLGVTEGQQTDRRNQKKTKIIPKIGEDVIVRVASVASPSSSVDNLELSSPKSQASSRNSLTTSWDSDAGIPAAVGSRPGSQVASSRQRPRKSPDLAQSSKRITSHTSISSSLRGKSSTMVTKKIRELNLELQNSEPSIPYIYTLKKRPKDEQIPIKQTEIHSSSETEEDEDIRSAAEDTVQGEGETSYLSSEDQVSDASDQDIRVRFDLLNAIRNFPNWDEVIAASAMDPSQVEGEWKADKGWYRDPLAGSSSSTQEEEMTVQSELECEHVSAEGTISDSDSEASSPPLLSSSELESNAEADWKVERPRVDVDPMPDFIQNVIVTPSESSESQCKERQRQSETYKSLEIYIYELVNIVVGRMEKGEHKLQKNLDKHKLLSRLYAEIEDNYNERCTNEYLTKRLTAIHLRRFKYSLIKPSSSSSINESNYRRYLAALSDLDFWLNKEHEAERISLTERYRLQMKLEERQTQDDQEIKRLEDLIRESLLSHRQLSERLGLVIENVFRQMRKKRDEMSETRLDLIIKQHNNSYVLQKLEETESISDELKLHTYLAAEVDVQQLGSTLSTKTAELNRLYSLITSKIHIISHLRCRRKLLSRNFRVAKDELLELRKKHFELRAKVYQIHMRHNKILAQIKEVRRKGGLQHYPLLLKDYDNTINIVKGRRERVSLMRAQHDSLLEKIEEVELAIKQSLSTTTQEDQINK